MTSHPPPQPTITTPSPPTKDLILYDVAIIGAGPGGIICAKTLREKCGPNLKIIAFEESNSVGGVWNRENRYQDTQSQCQCTDLNSGDNTTIQVNSSAQPIYDYLTTNLPKDLTSFSDMPFDAKTDFFPTSQIVLDYFQNYVSRHDLGGMIRLNERVVNCSKQKEKGEEKYFWLIHTQKTTKTTHGTRISSERYRSKRLLVCIGHFRKAFVPSIRGISKFQGTLLHSSAYQTPEEFRNKTVLIIGGGFSGCDIAGILSKHGHCARIIVSVRKWKPVQTLFLKKMKKNNGVIVRRGIDYMSEESGEVYFKDGEKSTNDGKEKKDNDSQNYSVDVPPSERPDVIIFATGYRYHYPFLPTCSPSSSIDNQQSFLSKDGYKMKRLYKRILHIDDTSLAFIGITNKNLSVTALMEYQAKWYATMVVQQNCKAFTKKDMENEVFSRRDDSTQDDLLFKFPAYCDSLAQDIGERGFWSQAILLRLPLHIKSLWARRHPFILWSVGLFAVPCLGVVAFTLGPLWSRE